MGLDIIGIENPVMDFCTLMEKMPERGGFAKLKDYSWQGGGNVGSGLVAAARLGAKCGIVGLVGEDYFGQFCIDDFKRHNIDTSHLLKDADSATSFCICVAETATMERSFIAKGGTRRQPTQKEIDKDYIATAKYIHLGPMGEASVQAAKWAREKGIPVVDDAGYFEQTTEANTGLIDYFVGSRHYYNGLFKDENYEKNCKAVQKRGPKTVVFTLGAKGCVGLDGDKYFEIPAFKDVPIVDTTGAGDVFHGAFIFGLLQGWDAEKTSKFSSAVSAIKCTRLGGRASIPDYKTVQNFIKTGKIDYTEIDKRVAFYRDGMINNVLANCK
ncbi:MAG TPA: carbohydrate kinase family protein [Dehalococcoidales bacterium]|jgi:sugar/nucleoside kinase (ribokinase family)|nr:carbohydrate kinase family protein [Dehalococcoidales bacterium]